MQRLAIAIVTASALAACGGSGDDVGSSSDEITGAAARVTRAEGNALRFESAISARVGACSSGPETCKDADGDGLVDAWEAAVLDKLRPAVTFDEDEPLLKDGGATFAMLGRVFPGAGGHVVVNILLVYTSDYGAQNPVCFHKSKHAGDVERVALELELDEGKGAARVIGAFTTGHEGTEDDQSRVWKGEELGKTLRYLDDAATHEPRWQVFPSQNKHATYATIEQCQSVRLKQWTHDFCIDEDCAPDRVRDAARFTRVPKIANAGEPGAPLVDDLAPLGYPNERAWSDDKFCGGLRVDAEAKKECPPSIKSKLLKDPFAG